MSRLALVLITVLALAGTSCNATPRDPEGTLEEVRGGTLRVGVTASDPWVTLDAAEPGGVEAEIVRRFAESLDAEIEWFEGSEEELFGALEYGQIDLIIAGLSSRTPFAKEGALTHPYLTTQIVVAVPQGATAPEEIAGVKVAVEKGTEAAGVLAKTDAEVVPVQNVTEVEGARAIEDYLLDNLDLQETGDTIIETDHVMAVRLGENGFMVTLERYLLEHADEIHQILEKEALL